MLRTRPYQSFAVVSLCFSLVAFGFKAASGIQSTGAETLRMSQLKEIGNRKAAGACLDLQSPELLTEGRLIDLPAGKSPTSCFRNAKTNQYAYAGYLNGQLQIIRVFTTTEVKKGAAE